MLDAAAADSIIPTLNLASSASASASASAARLIVVTDFLVDPKPANYLHPSQRMEDERPLDCSPRWLLYLQFYV